MDLSVSNKAILKGSNNWFKKTWLKKPASPHVRKYNNFNLIKRFSNIKLSSCFIIKRINELLIKDKLTLKERELLIKVLKNKEKALTFN
jgi:hypothetical protein